MMHTKLAQLSYTQPGLAHELTWNTPFIVPCKLPSTLPEKLCRRKTVVDRPMLEYFVVWTSNMGSAATWCRFNPA